MKRDVMKALVEAVTERFPEDRIKPGIVVSYIGDGFYASVKRYPRGLGSGEVVCSASWSSLEGVIQDLAYKFLRDFGPKRTAFERLASVLP